MARTKQAIFPARFVNKIRRTANVPPSPTSPQASNNSPTTGIGPGVPGPADNIIYRSPLVRKSSVRKSSVLAPKPTRISKHARKSAPITTPEANRDLMEWTNRANSNESTYAPSEGGEDEDEDSLFVPLDEPGPSSLESMRGLTDSYGIGTDHDETAVADSKPDIGFDDQHPSPHEDAVTSEMAVRFAPVAQMVAPSRPVFSAPPRQPTVETRASATPAMSNTSTRKTSMNPVKSDTMRRNPHSLPDLSAKLTSVITVTTRGPRNCDSKVVTLHVAMLEDKSPFLTRLAESSPGPDLVLPELDCDAFSKFAAWVYGGGFEFDTFASDDMGDILNSVLDCYTLGLKLEATQFANAVLEKACKVSAERGLVFRNDVVNAMFTRTNRGSKLRKWIVDEWVWQFDAEGVSEISWANDRVLEKEIVFEMFYTAAKRLGKGRQKHRSPSEMAEDYRIPPGQDVVSVD